MPQKQTSKKKANCIKSKKILILSASPHRDEIVDHLIKEELEKKGHDVEVKACLREGRDGVLAMKPDVVVLPPIRNPYSRDMAYVLKGWGIGVVSRHTEPSCDKADFEKMIPQQKMEIFGKWPYDIDAELVWSQDEADILNQRKVAFKAHAVGAFTVDAYLRKDVMKKHTHHEEFRKRYGFDDKKILLICSPWGFADAAPDLHIEDLDEARKDKEGQKRHFEMMRTLVPVIKQKWNVLVSIHPGVLVQPYRDICKELGIPLDTETTSYELKLHVDAFIHAGSTMAIGAHLLNKPAWQFGDVYAKDSHSWWGNPESALSKISPYCKTVNELVPAVQNCAPGTNANLEAMQQLEKGRFGLMDGKATKRAAEIISRIEGSFTLSWPESTSDYTQLILQKNWRRVMTPMTCGICKKEFYILNESYQNAVNQTTKETLRDYLKNDPPEDVWRKIWKPPFTSSCPWCSARFFSIEE